MTYTLITDGACSKKRGGIGLVILKDNKKVLQYSKSFSNVTNNQMELLAIIIGLKCFKKPFKSLTIISDSMYCIGCAGIGDKYSPAQNIGLGGATHAFEMIIIDLSEE